MLWFSQVPVQTVRLPATDSDPGMSGQAHQFANPDIEDHLQHTSTNEGEQFPYEPLLHEITQNQFRYDTP